MYKSLAASTSSAAPDAVAIALRSDAKRLPADFAELNESTDGALASFVKRPEHKLGAGAVDVLYPPTGPKRIYLLGLGGKKAVAVNGLRNACRKLASQLHDANVKAIRFDLPGDVSGDDAGRAIAEGLSIGNLKYTEFMGSASPKASTGGKLSIVVDAASRKGLKAGIVTGEAANFARVLVSTPPNVANPAFLVKTARKMARDSTLTCSVIEYKKAKELGLAGLCAVGQAGSTKPAMIILEHKPKGTAKDAPVMLVGKAITFDTGGYSLKPGAGMKRMKYDKSGGCAVLGAMKAIAKLKLPVRVVALVAAAENMVDTEAYRPDDILKMYNGVTVEVTNTDAEGRLVLADALAYGAKKFKPRAIVDLATLTGGVVTALGCSAAGIFCNDEKLRTALMDGGEAVGERLWRLPLWEEHRDQMRGEHSDICNSSAGAPRDAHPIQGAAFLSFFVAKDGDFKKNADIPWAHLDIAGTADAAGPTDPTGLFPKGPTGFGVRLLVKTLEGMK